LLPLAVVVILATFLVPHRAFRETFGYTIQGLCLFAVFITAVRYPDWGPMRLLNLRPVQWIGLLSYAIYLVHPLMLALAKSLTGPSAVPMVILATGLTGGAAAVLYYGVERPIGRLRKRYSIVDRSA
jgi:peptidoglycan/LPS O-acetylase OafA/YrhL